MRIDNMVEKVRVRYLGLRPVTIMDKKQKQMLNDILSYRSESGRGTQRERILYRIRYWLANNQGRRNIVDELVMDVSASSIYRQERWLIRECRTQGTMNRNLGATAAFKPTFVI